MSVADAKKDDTTILTRREATALSSAATDSLLLVAGLSWDEIASMRRKLRAIAADARDNG